MKLIITLFCLFSINAFSEVIIDIDGVRHSCQPTREDPRSFIRCVKMAYDGPFSRSESQALCKDARSTAPALCAIRAYKKWSRSQSLSLCTGALSEGPAECTEIAYAGPFSRTETFELCSNKRATKENAQCALELYSGRYSRREAIQMCKVNGRYPQLKNTRIYSKSDVHSLIKEANIKAFKKNQYK